MKKRPLILDCTIRDGGYYTNWDFSHSITQSYFEAMEKLPSTKIIHAYGQTELGPLATILEPEYHSVEGAESGVIRSVGRPVPSVEIEIVDENGLEVSRGVTGEIKVIDQIIEESKMGKLLEHLKKKYKNIDDKEITI